MWPSWVTLPYCYIGVLGDLALSSLGQCDLGTHLSLRQVKDHGGYPAGEDNEVSERKTQKRGGGEGTTLSLWIQQSLKFPIT